MAYECIASGSESFAATALQAADQYTTLISTAGRGFKGNLFVGAVVWSGLAGGTDAGTASRIDVRAYGYWSPTDTVASALQRTGLGVMGYVAMAESYQITIGDDAAGSKVFGVGASDNELSGLWAGPIWPYIAIRLDKEGDGTLTDGTVTVYWKLYGDAR